MGIFDNEYISEKKAHTEQPSGETAGEIVKQMELKKDQDKLAPENHIIQKFKIYKSSIQAYKMDFRIKEEAEARLASVQKTQIEYEKLWETAAKNARLSWKRNQTSDQEAADAQRDTLRNRAKNEKQKREEDVVQKEADLKQKQSKVDQVISQADQRDAILQKQLKQVEHYELKGFECDPKAEKVIGQACEKGYFTQAQKALVDENPQQFCELWAKTPEQLQNLERKFLTTGFLDDILTITSNEKIYQIFARRIGLIAGIICFLMSLLNLQFPNPVFSLFGRVSAFLGFAGSAYIMLAIVAKIIKKHKNVRVHNSKSGLIACVLAVLLSLLTFTWKAVPDVMTMVRSFGAGGSVGIGLYGGLMVYFALSQISVRNMLLSKSDFVLGGAYRALFRNASKTVNQRLRDSKKPLLEKGEMDAMIASYVRHHDYLQYLSQSARVQKTAEINAEIEKTKTLRSHAEDVGKQIQENKETLKTYRAEADRLNRKTDEKLKKDLQEIDRLHGVSTVPDFYRRSNLLDSDQRILAVAEKNLGISSFSAQDQRTAVSVCRKNASALEMDLKRSGDNLDVDVQEIIEWTESEWVPPLYNGDQETEEQMYNYQLEPSVVLLSKPAKGSREVTVIDHGCRPVNLVYNDGAWLSGDEESTANAALLIGMLWQGFTKIATPELLNIYIVDDTGRLQFSFPGKIRQSIPEFFHQTGMEERTNERSLQRGVRPLKGLYVEHDIENLNKSIYAKYQAIEDYMQVNRKEIEEAEKKTAGKDDIVFVNYCMSHGKTHDVKPYDIVIFVVPDGDENRDTYRNVNTMVQMVQQGAAKRIGFLPIILSSETAYDRKWGNFINYTRKSGVTYKVDLKSLKLYPLAE